MFLYGVSFEINHDLLVFHFLIENLVGNRGNLVKKNVKPLCFMFSRFFLKIFFIINVIRERDKNEKKKKKKKNEGNVKLITLAFSSSISRSPADFAVHSGMVLIY